MTTENKRSPATHRVTTVFLSGVIAVAVIGYFVSLNDGVPHYIEWEPEQPAHTADATDQEHVLPATDYLQIRTAIPRAVGDAAVSLKDIPQPEYDLFAEFEPDPAEKLVSLESRSETRAFNGAPPVIPHSVQQTNDAACYACHGKGIVIEDLVARPMSHDYLANCTQCHAPPPPEPFSTQTVSFESDFTGLAAPQAGQRAYPGAPPTIPHSTFMRENCLACHGGPTGWPGLETTHPWRNACLQCHAPTTELDQPQAGESPFLPGPWEDSL